MSMSTTTALRKSRMARIKCSSVPAGHQEDHAHGRQIKVILLLEAVFHFCYPVLSALAAVLQALQHSKKKDVYEQHEELQSVE